MHNRVCNNKYLLIQNVSRCIHLEELQTTDHFQCFLIPLEFFARDSGNHMTRFQGQKYFEVACKIRDVSEHLI